MTRRLANSNASSRRGQGRRFGHSHHSRSNGRSSPRFCAHPVVQDAFKTPVARFITHALSGFATRNGRSSRERSRGALLSGYEADTRGVEARPPSLHRTCNTVCLGLSKGRCGSEGYSLFMQRESVLSATIAVICPAGPRSHSLDWHASKQEAGRKQAAPSASKPHRDRKASSKMGRESGAQSSGCAGQPSRGCTPAKL